MKKTFFMALLAILAVSFTQAQDAPGRRGYRHHKQHRHHKHHRHQHRHGMKGNHRLSFSDQQKMQLKTMHQDFKTKMVALNKKENITVKEQRDQRALLVKQQREQFNKVLTPEQKTHIDQMKKERMVKRQEMASRRVDRMKEKLSLNDEQTAKIKTLNQQFGSNLEKIKADDSLDRLAKHDAFRSAMKQHRDEVMGVLTPDQINKLQQWKKDHRSFNS